MAVFFNILDSMHYIGSHSNQLSENDVLHWFCVALSFVGSDTKISLNQNANLNDGQVKMFKNKCRDIQAIDT